MNIPANLLPDWLMISSMLLLIPVLLWQAVVAEWSLLVANGLKHVYAVSVLLLAGLWWLKAEAVEGLQMHFLALSAMVLVFGWRLALLAGTFAMLLLTLNGVYDGWAFAVNAAIAVVLPVLLAHRLHALVYRWFPKHYFVYLIVAAHFGAMLVIAVCMLSGAGLLWLVGGYTWSQISYNYLPFVPVAMLAEGFINGAIMTGLTAFKPEWVRSFDDRDYLDGQ